MNRDETNERDALLDHTLDQSLSVYMGEEMMEYLVQKGGEALYGKYIDTILENYELGLVVSSLRNVI